MENTTHKNMKQIPSDSQVTNPNEFETAGQKSSVFLSVSDDGLVMTLTFSDTVLARIIEEKIRNLIQEPKAVEQKISLKTNNNSSYPGRSVPKFGILSIKEKKESPEQNSDV